MKLVNKIIVMVRLENGDDVKVSVKQDGGALVEKHHIELLRRLKQSIEPLQADALYYTVRSDIFKKKNNWKVKNYSDLDEIINEIFKDHDE